MWISILQKHRTEDLHSEKQGRIWVRHPISKVQLMNTGTRRIPFSPTDLPNPVEASRAQVGVGNLTLKRLNLNSTMSAPDLRKIFQAHLVIPDTHSPVPDNRNKKSQTPSVDMHPRRNQWPRNQAQPIRPKVIKNRLWTWPNRLNVRLTLTPTTHTQMNNWENQVRRRHTDSHRLGDTGRINWALMRVRHRERWSRHRSILDGKRKSLMLRND